MAKLSAPISIGKVASALGSTSGDLGTLCTTPKVNPYSRYKPYGFGDMVTILDESLLKSNNCGMIPRKHSTSSYSVIPIAWTQWNAPNDTQWKRLTDFNGYNHYALPWLSNVRVWFTNPTDESKPMVSAHPSVGSWKHYCKASFDINTEDNVTPAYMDVLSEYCITLIFAPYYGEDKLTRGICIGQSATVAELGNGSHSLMVEIPYSVVQDEWFDGKTIAMLCLAPKYTTAPNPLNLSGLYSLDMYNDAGLRAECVRQNTGMDAVSIAPPIGLKRYITASLVSSPSILLYTEGDSVYFDIGNMSIKLDTTDPDYIPDFILETRVVVKYNDEVYVRKLSTSFNPVGEEGVFANTGENFSISKSELRSALNMMIGTESTEVIVHIGCFTGGGKIDYNRDPVTQWLLSWNGAGGADVDYDIWGEMELTNGVGSDFSSFNITL